MQKFKPVFIEIMWMLIILNLTVLISIFVFNWQFLGSNFDIRLQDKYFTIASWKIILPLFIFITFITFLVKEIKYQYTRKIPNYFILCAGVVLIILITTINKQVILSEITFFGGGWTAYPPLSAISERHMKASMQPGIHVASNTLTVMQLVVTVCMLYVAFRMGANYYSNVTQLPNGVPVNGLASKPKVVVPVPKVKEVKQDLKS
jgi:hypothetical protein